MKIFLDTAHLESLKKGKETGLVDGVTTNPTHLSKESGNIVELLKAICSLMSPGDVSIEVTEQSPENVYHQAKQIAALATNVVVKVPCHLMYAPVIKKLVEEGVAVNVTLLFALNQGMMMCKLGVKYISPFVGRLDDMDTDGIQLLYDLRKMVDIYGFKTQILAASLRHARHVHEAILAGSDVGTLPVPLFESLMKNPLTDKGMQLFDDDWKKLKIEKFP